MKWNSRKLMVAIGTIIGVPVAELPDDSYWVAVVYIVIQGAVDFLREYLEYRKVKHEDE